MDAFPIVIDALPWLLAPALAAWVLTGLMCRVAYRLGLIDIPNARSSHSHPTPRGGGVAVSLCFLAATLAFLLRPSASPSVGAALLGAGTLIAAIGFCDDRHAVAIRWRLLAHFAAAGWILLCLPGVPVLSLLGLQHAPLWMGTIVSGLYLVWLLNLYNFMDGIDGLAAIEAICVCAGGGLLFLLGGHPQLAWLTFALGAACAGFLYWNFPRARIFLGDSGSGFIGICLGILSLQAALLDREQLWSWLILLGVFICDASYTLVCRLLRGDPVHLAHRHHAYQHAAHRVGRHPPVALAVAAINLLWLLPIALMVGTGRLAGPYGMAMAYAPLLLLAHRLGAGRPGATPAEPAG